MGLFGVWIREVWMGKSPDDGLGGISRRGLGGGGFGDLGSMTRAERAEKYQLDMKPYEDARLAADRGAMVKQYRERPSIWPDGIDAPDNRWYRADEWLDDGTYVGPPPCVKAANPDPGFLEREDAKRAAKLAKARAALGGVEAKLGVKPFVAPEEGVTKPPTPRNETHPSVTKPPAPEPPVTKPPGGRPRKGDRPLTGAERAAAARARKKDGEHGGE